MFLLTKAVPAMPTTACNAVFISYSHKDIEFLKQLREHIVPLERAGLVSSWSDQEIAPGSQWFDEIKAALARTKVAVMLVTASFLASEFIHQHELGPLLLEAEAGGICILWVPVRACGWKATPIKKFQAVLSPDRPLAAMTAPKRDEAWVKVCEQIEEALNSGIREGLEKRSGGNGSLIAEQSPEIFPPLRAFQARDEAEKTERLRGKKDCPERLAQYQPLQAASVQSSRVPHRKSDPYAAETKPATTPRRARRGWPIRWIPLTISVAAIGILLGWRLDQHRPAGMVKIPGGTFDMGSSPEEVAAARSWCEAIRPTDHPEDCDAMIFARELPQRRVRLSSFYLDATEVTNEAFVAWLNELLRQDKVRVNGRFVEAPSTGEQAVLLADLYPSYHPSHGVLFENGRFGTFIGLERWPASQLTWEAARRYCADHGQRLPTEAEWEWAARGVNQGSRFPWGNIEPRCDGVVFARLDGQACTYLGPHLRDVGTSSQDRSPQGVYDLAGNVSEWVQDPFIEQYEPCGSECVSPRTPEEQLDTVRPKRVFRGGNWNFFAITCRAAGRSQALATAPSTNIGFRCAGDKS